MTDRSILENSKIGVCIDRFGACGEEHVKGVLIYQSGVPTRRDAPCMMGVVTCCCQ